MSSIFSGKDRDLLIENLKLGSNPALTDAPGSDSCMAYSSVSFAKLSEGAWDYFARIIGETNRPPEDDIISLTWSREWGFSDIYEAGTGHSLSEDYSHKVTEEKTWVNIPNELGLGDELDDR